MYICTAVPGGFGGIFLEAADYKNSIVGIRVGIDVDPERSKIGRSRDIPRLSNNGR